MSLLRDIISRYLYYEDIQRLASDHDLPVSRTKDELVDELVSGGYLEPEEVVAFLRVDDLREICADLGIPAGASRDVLADRVETAISEDERPSPRRRKRRPISAASPFRPAPVQSEPATPPARPPAEAARRLPPLSIHFNLPERPPSEVRETRTEVSKASWGFAGILVTIVFASAIPLSILEFGTVWGSLIALGAGLVAAVMLVLTAGSWSSWVDRRFQKDS